MKNSKLRIVSGDFTKVGNFTGYTATGKRVHIFARQMASIGVDPKSKPADYLPFFVMADEKSYPARLGKDGKPVEGAQAIENRLTATAVFKTKDSLIESATEDLTLEAEVTASVSTKMKDLDLTDEAINRLLESVI